jgi:hypothetical protein
MAAAAAAAGLQQQVVRGVAAAVVRGLLMLAGDVEPNPGPPKGAGKEKKGGRKGENEENEAENMDASRQSQSGVRVVRKTSCSSAEHTHAASSTHMHTGSSGHSNTW